MKSIICLSGLPHAWKTGHCIVQGGSDKGFFRRLERLVVAVSGVEPRCWYEPQYDWQQDSLVADET